jgi:hypothetical protein
VDARYVCIDVPAFSTTSKLDLRLGRVKASAEDAGRAKVCDKTEYPIAMRMKDFKLEKTMGTPIRESAAAKVYSHTHNQMRSLASSTRAPRKTALSAPVLLQPPSLTSCPILFSTTRQSDKQPGFAPMVDFEHSLRIEKGAFVKLISNQQVRREGEGVGGC